MPKEIVVPKEDQMAYERFHFAQAAKANGLVICSGPLGPADMAMGLYPLTD